MSNVFQPPIAGLLRQAHNVLSIEIGRAVAGVAPEQRPSHGNVMELLDYRDGQRLTELAEGAGMAPQSIGELVDQLEALGHVERRPDPSDRRAKLIYRTQKGKAVSKVAAETVAKIESDLVDELGAETLETIRAGLTQIVTSRGQQSEGLDAE